MQAVIADPNAPSGIRFERERGQPTPAAGEVLIRVRAAGICSTDLEITRGYMGFSGVLGHEFVGSVVGGESALRGRRVVGEINCPCGRCATCLAGQPHHCPTRTVLGIAGRDGAFAEYLTLPAANCHAVPESISDEAAVFVEPLAAAAHVLDAIDLAPGQSYAVVGPGRLGTLVARVLALQTTNLTVIGRAGPRLERVRRGGIRTLDVAALTPERSYDVVVECSGSPAGLRLALDLCRPCGTIVLKSTYATPAPLDLAGAVIHELRVVGSRCGSFEAALDLLDEGYVAVSDLVTGDFQLEQADEAFAAARRPDQLKVLLRPPSA